MAISIPASLVRMSRNINMTLDASLLGPNQRRAYERAAKSGAFVGYAPPHLMAAAARTAAGLPTIRVGQYGRLYWSGNPFADERVRRAMLAMVAEIQLGDSGHAPPSYSALLDKVDTQRPAGEQWMGYPRNPAIARHVKRLTVLPALDIVPELITIDLIDEKVPS